MVWAMALKNSSKINEIVCKYIQRVNNKLGIINQFFGQMAFRPNKPDPEIMLWWSKWMYGEIMNKN